MILREKTNKAVLRAVLFLLTLCFLALGLSSCGSEPSALATRLFDHRVADLGDTDATQALLNTMLSEGYGTYTFDVETDSTPKALHITLNARMDGGDDFTDNLTKVGCVLLMLMDNCDKVDFTYQYGKDSVILTQTDAISLKKANKLLKCDNAHTYVEDASDLQKVLHQFGIGGQ